LGYKVKVVRVREMKREVVEQRRVVSRGKEGMRKASCTAERL
jgi:hypothetical protein